MCLFALALAATAPAPAGGLKSASKALQNTFLQRAEIKESNLMALEGFARINAYIDSTGTRKKHDDGVVVEVPLWDGHPWHVKQPVDEQGDPAVRDIDFENPHFLMDPSQNMVRWGGLGDDLLNVAVGLIAAEAAGAKEVSFRQAEEARTKDGYKMGFDEVFPDFKDGVIPVKDHASATKSIWAKDAAGLNKLKGISVKANGDTSVVATGCCAYLTQGRLDTRELRRVLRKYIAPALPKARDPDLIARDDEMVIHIVGGAALAESEWQPPPVPFAFYTKAIQDAKLTKIRIVTLPPPLDKHPAIDFLQNMYGNERVTIQHRGLLEDFQTLATASNIMMDHMGFSWMAPMLNPSPKRVYIPHFISRKDEDFLPEGVNSSVGFTFPRDDPKVRVCVLEAEGALPQARALQGISYASNRTAMLNYLESGKGMVKKHCSN